MLTRDALLHIARRYDTVMSHAMLRALGYGPPARGAARRKRPRNAAKRARYRDMLWCFRNHGSPMDWH